MRGGALAAALAIAGCTAVTGLPAVESEETAPSCSNGIDDDLDGDMDCADESCSVHCYDGDRLDSPDVSGCFRDEALGLAFRVVDVADRHQRCEPDPEAAPQCAAGEHRPPGASACAPPGEACPSGEWPDAPDDGRALVHVREGAAGGDGSSGAPFGTLAEALAAAPASARVLLARGAYDAPASVDRAVELRGACAAESVVRGPLRLAASGASVKDLSVEASAGPALVVVEDARVGGLRIAGAVSVTGAALDVEDTTVEAGDGVAVEASGGATLGLVTTTLTGESGISIEEATLTVRGVAVRGTRGVGVRLGGGARTAGAAGLVVEPSEGTGIEVACDAGAERCADLEDVVVRFPPGLPDAGRGILVSRGRARFRRAFVARTLESALEVEDAFVDFEDSTIEAVEAGGAAHVAAGGELWLVRVFLHTSRPRGLLVDPGGRANAIDFHVLGSDRVSTGDMCVEARGGSALVLSRFLLEDCGVCGLRLEPDVELVYYDGLVGRSTRGVCLAPEAAYPIPDLTRSVSYRDNSGADIYRE